MNTLLLGGVRSGKSRYAAELARELALPVTLIATGAGLDDEMRQAASRLIAAAARLDWTGGRGTHTSRMLHSADVQRVRNEPAIVDCLTLWLSNLLCGEDALRCGANRPIFSRRCPRSPGTA